MKIRVVVEVDVNFDLESDGEIQDEGVVDSDIVGQAVVDSIHNGSVVDTIADYISDRSGWCVLGVSILVPEVECIG